MVVTAVGDFVRYTSGRRVGCVCRYAASVGTQDIFAACRMLREAFAGESRSGFQEGRPQPERTAGHAKRISAVLGFRIMDTVAAMRIRLLAEVVTVGLTSHDGVRVDDDQMAVEPECSSEDKFPQV